jgi:hypothetical protein
VELHGGERELNVVNQNVHPIALAMRAVRRAQEAAAERAEKGDESERTEAQLPAGFAQALAEVNAKLDRLSSLVGQLATTERSQGDEAVAAPGSWRLNVLQRDPNNAIRVIELVPSEPTRG